MTAEKGRAVLIIEDVAPMRLLLEQAVAGIEGYRVSGTAGNAWEARLEMMRRRPDLILLDEILPGETGIQMLTEIRGLGIPVLLLTGIENPTHPVARGAQGRVSKPGLGSAREMEEGRALLKAAMDAAAAGPLSG